MARTTTNLAKTLFATLLLATTASAQAAIIIDGSTQGFYNDGLGDLAALDGPGGFFLGANSSEGDPTNANIAEPAVVYGGAFGADWLGGDLSGGSWSAGPVNIPAGWAVNTETAIVYEFNLAGASDLHIDVGVDNGILIWLNGVFLRGAQASGGANINEYDIDVFGVSAGLNRLQILREDHGGGTGFAIAVDANPTANVPAPAALALLGLGALLGLRRRRR